MTQQQLLEAYRAGLARLDQASLDHRARAVEALPGDTGDTLRHLIDGEQEWRRVTTGGAR